MAEESPFANFVPSTEPPAAAPAAPEKERKKSGGKKKPDKSAEPHPLETVAATPKKVRKARTKKTGEKKSRPIKIDLGIALDALSGLHDEDTQFVMQVVKALQPFPKKQRVRIIEALAKVFA